MRKRWAALPAVAALAALAAMTGLLAWAAQAGRAASSAGARAAAPAAQRAPAAAPAAGGGIHKIRHVVVIMQENRSFDSYFGTFPGADGIPMRGGVPAVCVPDPASGQCVRPFHDAHDLNRGGPHGDAAAQPPRRPLLLPASSLSPRAP